MMMPVTSGFIYYFVDSPALVRVSPRKMRAARIFNAA
jgi:hypothetical protein